MQVFDLDQHITETYKRFSQSFMLAKIRSPELKAQIEALYTKQGFWPSPLISLNLNIIFKKPKKYLLKQ